MSAPAPLAHQWIGSTPFEKKTIPNRSGGVFAFAAATVLAHERQRFQPGQRQRDAHAAQEVTP